MGTRVVSRAWKNIDANILEKVRSRVWNNVDIRVWEEVVKDVWVKIGTMLNGKISDKIGIYERNHPRNS